MVAFEISWIGATLAHFRRTLEAGFAGAVWQEVQSLLGVHRLGYGDQSVHIWEQL